VGAGRSRAERGFPARLVLPGRYGEASVKWLTEVEVRDTPVTVPAVEVSGEGALRDPRPRGFAPAGATGYHVRRVTVVTGR